MKNLNGLWRPLRLSTAKKEEIEDLRPLLERCDREAISDRRYPLEGINAMIDAGLFNQALAASVGGKESHPVVEMEIYESIARISVSAAWNVLVGNVHTGWASAYLSDDAVAVLFPTGHRTIVAGQAAPLGKGISCDGGYRVTGSYSWGSGISHADWVMGGFFVKDTGEHRVFVTPKTSVSVLDNWHVLGIEGSGSYDYRVDDLFIPAGYSYSFSRVEPKRGGPRYTLPWASQASVPHSAVALGGSQHAFEAIAQLAATRKRSGQISTLAERGAFQRDLGEAYLHINSVRELAAAHFEHMADRVSSDKPLSDLEHSGLVAVAAYSCQAAVDVANMAFRYGGGNSVRLDSPIQRVLRDLLVAQQHVAATDTSYDAIGREILGLGPAPN